jgi:hypothetical protein
MAHKNTPTNNDAAAEKNTVDTERPKCGIIMPISAIGTYPASHWDDVRAILKEAIESAGFHSDLVSEAEDSTIIQKTIIQNLYNNAIVVCDVSGKNPNVMFELGIRLTFDKPTVVVKDEETAYSFDTSPIEHVPYPSSLHYHEIVKFKQRLADKIIATQKAAKDPKYSTFLKHFGEFTVPKLDQTEVSSDQFIIQRLDELTQSIGRLERTARYSDRSGSLRSDETQEFDISRLPMSRYKPLIERLFKNYQIVDIEMLKDKMRVEFPIHMPRSRKRHLAALIDEEIAEASLRENTELESISLLTEAT